MNDVGDIDLAAAGGRVRAVWLQESLATELERRSGKATDLLGPGGGKNPSKSMLSSRLLLGKGARRRQGVVGVGLGTEIVSRIDN